MGFGLGGVAPKVGLGGTYGCPVELYANKTVLKYGASFLEILYPEKDKVVGSYAFVKSIMAS